MKSVLVIILLLVRTGAPLFTEKCSRIVCYYEKDVISWFHPNYIDPSLCTHIVVSGFSITRKYNLNLLHTHYNNDPLPDLVKFKEKHPHLKILISIQNDEFFDGFVAMYSSPTARRIFFHNTILLLRKRKLDGVKIDEQLYKGSKGNFSDFISDFACSLSKEARDTGNTKLILSVGIPVNNSLLVEDYDIRSLSENADMLDIASYYFQVPEVTDYPEYHSPLGSKDPNSTRSIEYVSKYITSQGIIDHKTNIGLSLKSFEYYLNYAGSYFLKSINAYDQNCVSHRRGSSGIGRYQYPETGVLIEKFYSDKRKKYLALVIQDDVHTLTEKVKNILHNDFGGVVVKSFEHDEYSTDNCNGMMFPLLKAIKKACGL
ncbi:hypothetical protein Btru_042837 [Bulinus truncatus]|nr:hypothetical protein Btru_042837 [Bulinus truncatus]